MPATLLSAHSVPPEFKGSTKKYLEFIVAEILPFVAQKKLAGFVDIFCEKNYFSPIESLKYLAHAKKYGLIAKIHAEQLSNSGGTKLAARYGALSADHLEYAREKDVRAMAEAGMVAVILPGAFYTLGETQRPPIELLRQYQVPMAVASDANPGSSPLTSLLLAMNMACTLFSLTPQEALSGVTRNAASALGLLDRGTIAAGQRADLAVWNVEHPVDLSYRIGFNPLYARIFGGRFDPPHC